MTNKELRQELLLLLIKNRFGGDQTKFADEINGSRALVYQWTAGTKVIGDGTCRKIEIALNLPQGWLDNEKNKINQENSIWYTNQGKPEEFVPIIAWDRVLTWDGTPTEEERRNTIPIHISHVPKGAFALQVRDNNMFNSHTGEGIRAGEYVVAEKGGEPYTDAYVLSLPSLDDKVPVLKRYATDGTNVFLGSENPLFPPVPLRDNKQVVAVAVGAYRPFIRPAGV
jgi:SOS-response transcriptional repressor LexA